MSVIKLRRKTLKLTEEEHEFFMRFVGHHTRGKNGYELYEKLCAMTNNHRQIVYNIDGSERLLEFSLENQPLRHIVTF